LKKHRLVPILLATAFALLTGCAVKADDVNKTGQGQQTPGSGPSNPENPGQDDKPSYPGDQPGKQGMDPTSQVHNIDHRDLSGKKHKESEKTP
jgi:hypothetical protein